MLCTAGGRTCGASRKMAGCVRPRMRRPFFCRNSEIMKLMSRPKSWWFPISRIGRSDSVFTWSRPCAPATKRH